MNVQVSPDGQWWWNGQAWNPVGTYAPATPSRPPGALIAVIGINLAGAALVLLLGLLILVVGQRPDFQQQLANDASITSIGAGTFVLVLSLVLIGYGLFLAVVNSLLGWFMVKRHAWAWITTIILLGLGMLLQLFSAIGSPQSLIWVAIFQVPPLVLLLLGPTRRWCHIGGRPGAPTQSPYPPYPQAYGGYQAVPPVAPPPPPVGPPQY